MENQSPTPQSEGNAESGGKAGQHSDKGGYSVDAEDLISKLLAVGLTDDDDFPTSVRMERIPREIFEPGKKKKTRALVREHSSRDVNETSPNSTHSPWLSIAENIQHYLRTSFQNVMNKMQSQSSGEIKASFVARIGKVFFHGPTVSKSAVLKKVLGIKNNATGNVRKTFYTNVPVEYMQAVEDQVVPRTEFGNAAEKEYYHVKVLDQHGVTLSCKCSATKDGGKLEIHKASIMPSSN
ncbi:uncharacterized protein LOC131247433 [Magnolia sinica]|uniref:uncharacterized protein LOC131247433 n=1 Tax=Magnolia sinica TaxID=86752 RepID=UPI002659F71C|nr:uncharacterized protein LOC131247433 [Magnolia sinica]